MLKVDVTIYPAEGKSALRRVGSLTFENVTPEHERNPLDGGADYRVTYEEGAKTRTVSIDSFDRSRGAWGLLAEGLIKLGFTSDA